MNVCLRVFQLLSLFMICNGCQWSTNDGTLDFSCLANKVITGVDSDDAETRHDYIFSVCSSKSRCNGESVMVSQILESDPTGPCYTVSRWNASVTPTYDASANSWTFDYRNGDKCGGVYARQWKPTFVCNSSVEYHAGMVKETYVGSCEYEVTIHTKYACIGSPISCSDSSSSGLSGGWIFIIILISAFFLYCIIGYFVMAFTVNKDGGVGDFKNNVPNKSLWINCIPLILAGCSVTKDCIIGLTNRGGSSDDDKDETLVENDGGGDTAQ